MAETNTLIAVAGSSNDGTAGLQDETASFAATRKEIEAFAHIILRRPREILSSGEVKESSRLLSLKSDTVA